MELPMLETLLGSWGYQWKPHHDLYSDGSATAALAVCVMVEIFTNLPRTWNVY